MSKLITKNDLKGILNQVLPVDDDSSWIYPELTSQFENYSEDTKVRYRKVGNIVTIIGAVNPTSTITGSDTWYTIFTLPEGYRPSTHMHLLMQGSGNAVWLLGIGSDGDVKFSRHRYNNATSSTYAYSDVTTSNWLPLHAEFMIAESVEKSGVRGGGGGSVDSTAIPTANKVAEFDDDAYMNSSDKTDEEISEFLDSIVNTSGQYVITDVAMYGRGDIGEIKPFAGSVIPTGWLLCDGSAISRTTYSDLFAVIGTTYGTGDGSTTFNLPDLRDRFPVGAGTTYSLNSKGGSKDAVVVNHTHLLSSGWQSASGQPDRITYGGVNGQYQNTGYGNVQFVQSTGETGTNKNLPPYIGINFIIFAQNNIASVSNASIDIFYPIGSYYETSDSTFDPNASWGGSWTVETRTTESRTLLWTNPSPTSDFTAGAVSLPNVYGQYSNLEILYKASKTEDNSNGSAIMEKLSCNMATSVSYTAWNNAWYLRHRARWWANEGMYFDSAYYNNLGDPTASGQNDANLIPYKIWGIKDITKYYWHRIA